MGEILLPDYEPNHIRGFFCHEFTNYKKEISCIRGRNLNAGSAEAIV